MYWAQTNSWLIWQQRTGGRTSILSYWWSGSNFLSISNHAVSSHPFTLIYKEQMNVYIMTVRNFKYDNHIWQKMKSARKPHWIHSHISILYSTNISFRFPFISIVKLKEKSNERKKNELYFNIRNLNLNKRRTISRRKKKFV